MDVHYAWQVSREGEEVDLIARGRHDPCVVPRAVPMVDAMAALVLADQLMQVGTFGMLGCLLGSVGFLCLLRGKHVSSMLLELLALCYQGCCAAGQQCPLAVTVVEIPASAR